MSDEDMTWAAVRQFTYRTCGVVLEEDRRYLLSSRLEPIARELGFASISQYVQATCSSPGSPAKYRQAMLDAMTTHETSFFRDASFWQLLEKTLLPALLRPSGPRALNVWSAACSTGQEAYSLAMLLAERFPPLLDGARITATDVAESCLEQGRNGIYRVIETNRGLSAARLVRHFEQVPSGFRVRQELRQRVTWQYANLLGTLPYPRGFDVIMCRNVLIYFNEADRARVVAGLIKSLAPGGVLGLGSSEVVRGLTSLGAGWYTARAEGGQS